MRKKIGIDFITGRISKSEYSHKAAWCYMYANQLRKNMPGLANDIEVLHEDTPWDEYAYIFIYHGMEFSGSLNIFGGANADVSSRLRRLIEFKGEIVSMDIPMPDYGELGKSRLKSCDDHWRETDWDAISKKCKEIKHIRHPNQNKAKKLLIGDSHSFSMYSPNTVVIRQDSKTLFGALKEGIYNGIMENGIKDLSKFIKITLYYGNIDIRHHLCRQDNPHESIDKMLEEYEKQLKHIQSSYGIEEIELIALLPIENERRKLPKTGYYNGTPYYGSWENRNSLQKLFNLKLKVTCVKNDWKFWAHPTWFQNESGELDFEFMESPRSVHLARKYYRWDLINDCPNYPNMDLSKLEYKNVHLLPLTEAETSLIIETSKTPAKKEKRKASTSTSKVPKKKNKDIGVKLVSSGKKVNKKLTLNDLF